MDTSTLSPEETAIHIKEGELRQNVNGAWICGGVMVLLAFFSLSMYLATSHGQSVDFGLIALISFMPLLFAGLAAMSWIFAVRDRKLLEQLKALASRMTQPEDFGIWPPLPSVPFK